ncbi:MAG: transporter substrate-binding domain-containing protein [Clostridiales Family XIII bacterium]|jgi:polar amino acid transport system substrate-binding protein|nr:transporter substrate-binding domain-containing protein [Clostridiales Family XIII bacterium]
MKKFRFIAVLLLVAVAMAGCGGGGGDADQIDPETGKPSTKTGKLSQIKDAGYIVMYTNAEFPPYEFLDGNDIVGVDVEIGRAIADEIGVELEVVNADFGGLVASIASGKGDVGISGITVTEDRKREVDFSVPYVDSVQYLIIPEDSGIRFVEDLATKTIGVQTGTTGSMLVEDEINVGVLKAEGGAELRQYTSAPIAMQDLLNGRLDAVVIDELVAIALAGENPGYTAKPFIYSAGTPMTEQFAVAVAKGNEDLLAVIDKVVGEMVEDGLIEHYIQQYSE